MPDPATRARYDARFQAVTLMGWVRWVLGVIVAVLVTLIIVGTTSTEDSRNDCARSAERANATASNWEQAASVRSKEGDLKTAAVYRANVLEIRRTIPMPHGWEGHLENRGKSAHDRQAGCNDAYPRPIPFVH